MNRFSGTETSVKSNVDSVTQIAEACGSRSFESASNEQQMEALWSARKQALWASLAVRPEGTEAWSTDVAVPISRMAELIGMLERPV
jgi:D-lactate dehydrogenase (cytochrome)